MSNDPEARTQEAGGCRRYKHKGRSSSNQAAATATNDPVSVSVQTATDSVTVACPSKSALVE